MLIYPPFCDLCLIGFVCTDDAKVRAASQSFFEQAKTALSAHNFIALGPMPARVSKISNKYRHRLILKCKNSTRFRKDLGDLLSAFCKKNQFGDVTVYIDMNSQTLI